MKRLILSCLSVGFALTALAQGQNQAILLTNHSIIADGDSPGAYIAQQDELVQGSVYRILQSSQMNMNILIGSVQILEYLPKNAFVASIPAKELRFFKDVASRMDITVLKIEPEWKLSKNLFNQNIPEWAWLDGVNFKMWVRYHQNLDPSFIKNDLAGKGYTVIDENRNERLVALSVTPGQVNEIAELPYLIHLQEMEDPGHPENHVERTDHRVNYLQASFPGNPKYDGTGVVVGHGDDGMLGDHVDYTGRLTQNSPPSNGDHGDHVAGTIFGAGNKDPRAKGMAPGAEIYYQDYPDNLNDADLNFTTQNVRITSSSYSNGCNAGYTNFTRQMDQDAIDHPEMIHVFSAGNNGTSDCQYGAGSGWGNVTGGHKIAKNVVTVANLNLTDGIAGSSSRGPASDGRIKPDVGAVGTSVNSTTDMPVPNSYTLKTGTSMSCPGTSGTLATLYQAYRDSHGQQDPIHAGLLKAILENTAEDLGKPGPDFIYGYGRINARRAANAIENNHFIVDSISSTAKTFNITQPSGTVKEVRIMLYWPDVPASTIAARALVNDLDLDVSIGATSYDPWVLDPTPNPVNLNAAAVRARDSLNNMEQVTITDPATGNITVDVSAFNIPSGTQQFFITYEFVMEEVVLTYPVGGEGLRPNGTETIRWDASDGPGLFKVEYSTDGGTSWNSVASNIAVNRRYATWNPPATPTADGKIRVIRGQDTSESPGSFVIAAVPSSFSVASSCPDTITLSWDAVTGATGYEVYQLGTKYMDSIGSTTDTFYSSFQANPNLTTWYSVASVVNGKSGQRAIAIENQAGIYNCQLNKDLLLASVLSPLPGVVPDCFASSGKPVTVKLTNKGIFEVFNFDVSYSFNGGATVTNTVTDTIPIGGSLTYTFTGSSITLNAGTPYTLEVWVDYATDQNAYNDTIKSDIFLLNSSAPKTLPYFNDFESFSSCSTNDNCGGTNCSLSDGWMNLSNGQYDDIDFRVNDGTTPSAQTGPFVDHNPGTISGNYLYLEASNGCDSSEAILLSPCMAVDSLSAQPKVEIWWHMYGLDMGILRFDLITEGGIIPNVIAPIIGNNGNFWNKSTINLNAYKGQTVVLRLRGKTGFGFRSDLAIDDFSFFSSGVNAPVSALSANDSSVCTGTPIIFQSLASGSVDNYLWNFGQGASPATATTAGPHSVVYNIGGIKNVSLDVNNPGGSDIAILNVSIQDVPISSFSFSITQNTVKFTDGSSFNPDEWHWDFGDGDTSDLASPTHAFTSPGTYYVSLTASNECGTDTYADSITISNVGIPELTEGYLSLYPNPTTGQLLLEMTEDWRGSEVSLLDLSSKVIGHYGQEPGTGEILEMDLSDLPSGVYIIRVENQRSTRNLRILKKN